MAHCASFLAPAILPGVTPATGLISAVRFPAHRPPR